MTPVSSSRPTNPRLALIAIAAVFAILNMDITTVNVALVTLGKDLHADLEDLQWGLNSYMLAFAALIVAAGRVADVFGRRRCLLAGAIVFAIASLLCGIAPTLSVLVIGRVLQGAGGALMLPAGMAIISSVYNAEERAAAMGILVGIAGVAQSIGPLVGGFLTAEVSWRLVFLINLPLIVVIMIIALRAIQDSRDENASHRIDIAGVVVLGTALTSFLVGLDLLQGSDRNPPLAVGLIVLSLALLVVFVIIERRTTNPIVDGKLLQIPAFFCSCVASCFLGFVFFLFLFMVAVYLQEQFGYSALTAGIGLVPFSLVLAVTGVMSGRLTKPLSTADTANPGLRVDGAGTGDPVVCPGIVRIQWDGDSISPDCRRGRARIYIAKHRWSRRGFAGTFRSGNGNDLHVSIWRGCDWRRRCERTSRCLFPAPSRLQII